MKRCKKKGLGSGSQTSIALSCLTILNLNSISSHILFSNKGCEMCRLWPFTKQGLDLGSQQQGQRKPFAPTNFKAFHLWLNQQFSTWGSDPFQGVEWPFHRDCLSDILHIRHLQFIPVAKLQLWNRNENNIMVEGHHSMRNCTKVSNIRKVENHWTKGYVFPRDRCWIKWDSVYRKPCSTVTAISLKSLLW